MDSTMQAVLQFVEENDVKFIRLAFCDVMGTLKNIAIMPSELPRAFETGVSFDASSILGFAPVDKSDLFLFPDAATLGASVAAADGARGAFFLQCAHGGRKSLRGGRKAYPAQDPAPSGGCRLRVPCGRGM